MIKRKFSLFIAALLSLLIITPALVHAAIPNQGINLQISPLPIQLNIKPGTSSVTDLRVRNSGAQAEKLQLKLLKVSQDDNGEVHLTEPTATDEWTKWVSFSKSVFDAPAGQWQTIKMTTNVPKTAAFGYYFAVEYLRAEEAKAKNGSTSTQGAVATFILLNAEAPGAKRQAEIESFKTNKSVYEFLPVNFVVKIRNTGNVHVAPTGNIFITKSGKQVDSIQVNATAGNILPKASRYFTASWDNGFPRYEVKKDANGQPILNKKGQPEMTLKWDFSKVNKLRFGHYQAHLVMVYSDGQRDVPIESTVSFWVIPWRIIIVLFVVIILMAIGLWSLLRRAGKTVKKVNKRVKSDKKSET